MQSKIVVILCLILLCQSYNFEDNLLFKAEHPTNRTLKNYNKDLIHLSHTQDTIKSEEKKKHNIFNIKQTEVPKRFISIKELEM